MALCVELVMAYAVLIQERMDLVPISMSGVKYLPLVLCKSKVSQNADV